MTFVFADAPESAALWESDHEAMQSWVASWDRVFSETVERLGGKLVRARGESEGFFAVFTYPEAAVTAAVEILGACHRPDDGYRVRFGINSGHAMRRDGDLYGTAVNRAARLKALAHPGQILVAQNVADSMPDDRIRFKDLGSHRLRDLALPEHLYQVVHPQIPTEFPPLMSLDASPNNLPIQLTTFVGRGAESASVKALLASSRLVTLTGPGGAGKTRLALQVAADLIDTWSDGVWLVDLAPLRDAASVAETALSAMGLREVQNEAAVRTLENHLRRRTALMIFDNTEHVIEASADLCAMLLRSCPGLQVLATSREPLGVDGEVTFRVPAMEIPDPSNPGPVQALAGIDSVNLFLNRATAVDASFSLTDQNAVWVAQLCKRLDGMPLAIELAAARVRVLSPEQIASRLDDRFQLLSSSSRTALPRQKTLKALIDWSYDLLSKEEKTLWRRMSWFAGGSTIEAVEAICTDQHLTSYDVLDLLTQLVDKSLLLADTGASVPRYRQLESIREYGLEKLKDFGEEEVIARRHAEWFLGLSEEAEGQLWGPDQVRWFDRLESERGNLRRAIQTFREDRQTCSEALRMAAALWEFHEVRGHFEEGRRWIEEALDHAQDAPAEIVSKAMRGAGNLAFDQGDLDAAARLHAGSIDWERTLATTTGLAKAINNLGVVEQARGNLPSARELYEEALELMRGSGDERGVSVLLSNLGTIAHHEGNAEMSERLHTESLTLRRKLGNKRGIAHSLNNLGNLAKERHDFDGARSLYLESLEIRQELGDRSGIAVLSHNLGGCALEEGDLDEARRLFAESLKTHEELGDKKGIADALEEMAKVVLDSGDATTAAAISGAASGLREQIGANRELSKQTDHQRAIDNLKVLLGEEGFQQAWNKGLRMELSESIALAIGEG